MLVLQGEMNTNPEKYSQLIKAKAKKFGFQSCGISKADFLEEDAKPVSYTHLDVYKRQGQY